MNRPYMLMVTFAFCFPAICQTSHTDVGSNTNQLVVEEVAISGTTTLDNQQLNEINSSLTGRRMGDDENEVTVRIRDAFGEKGYALAKVTNVKISPLDPLAQPKRVRLEADVAEGPRCKIGEISFTGNRDIGAEELLKALPIKQGDFYSIGKLRSGLESIREHYRSKGFLEMWAVPSFRIMNGSQVVLLFDITEGPQYRMGALELVGKSGAADELQQHWKLTAGDPFDASYLEKFLNENSSLLPTDFSAQNDAFMVRDCKHLTVTVRVELDPKRPWRPRPNNVDCDAGKDPSKPTGD